MLAPSGEGLLIRAVQVSMTLPRPELSETLGVTYRRIPILAIGRDVYTDTSLIASALERRYPASDGYGTLLPHRKGGGSSDTGMAKALAMFYLDRAVFPLAAASLPYSKFPESFLKDRSDVSCVVFRWPAPFLQEHKYMDRPINVQALSEIQPKFKSELASHIVRQSPISPDGLS